MHDFTELTDRCATFTLRTLNELHDKIIVELQTSGSTTLVKNLQMIRLQKVILAVGMFSIFDAILQDRLNCENGFTEAKKILKENGEMELLSHFQNIQSAINALKHGRGKSYYNLISKVASNPNIKI